MDNSNTEFRWLRKPEVVARTGLSFATLWRWSKNGQFPRWHAIGPRTVALRSDELDAWMQSRPVSSIPSPRKRTTPESASAVAEGLAP